MNIFTTHYYLPDGSKWSGDKILAIDWNVAEYIASYKGLEVTGKLVLEVDCDDEFNIDWSTVKDYQNQKTDQ